MGFLKKITRPISRALDKLVPNELKPALPFLAAAAPFMAPGLMSIGGGTMFSRALMSGGLNLGAQLAQEGSDGDFSGLSTLMAAATGALSGGGPGKAIGMDSGAAGDTIVRSDATGAADFFKNKAAGMDPGFAKSGLGALEKSSNYLSGVGETLRTNPFSMEGLKAGLVPIGQGTTDLAVAENRRLMKDYEREQADYEAGMDSENSNRAFAIRQSMESYGFTEQEILDAIEAAGYRAGGRVGLKGGGADFGGIPAAIQNIQEDAEEMITIMTDNGPIQIEKSVYESMPGMFMDTTTSAYGDAGRGRPVPEFADGGRIGLREGGVLAQILPQASQITAISQRPSLGSFQPLQQAQSVFPRLNELEQGVNIAENKLTSIRDRLGNERGTLASMAFQRPLGLQPAFQPLNMLSLNRGSGISALQSGPVAQGMKDGGLMNLGGREMDMRGGGFIPIGKKERADDVPARLSKNEFVMTADAVRAAGGGSVNEGAKRMYETMNRLEARA